MIIREVTANELLEQFISVETADLTAGAIVVRNVGRVLSQQITDDLVDGIVTFFGQCGMNAAKDLLHTFLIVGRNGELNGAVSHGLDLLCDIMTIITGFYPSVKVFS